MWLKLVLELDWGRAYISLCPPLRLLPVHAARLLTEFEQRGRREVSRVLKLVAQTQSSLHLATLPDSRDQDLTGWPREASVESQQRSSRRMRVATSRRMA